MLVSTLVIGTGSRSSILRPPTTETESNAMMGPGHASTSLAAGALTLPFAPVDDIPSQLAWVVVVGGCGYLPDLDQTGSTSGKTWGWATGVLARIVSFLGKGHRGGSHDFILGTAFFGLAFALASTYTVTAILAAGLAIGLALHAFDILVPGNQKLPPFGNAALSLTWAAWLITSGGDFMWWLPLAAMLGVLTHIAGDAITVDGVPVPFSWLTRKRTFGVRLFKAGAPVEKWIVWCSLVVTVLAVGWFYFGSYLSKLIPDWGA